jgi:tRNA(Ile)-lysidine synthase
MMQNRFSLQNIAEGQVAIIGVSGGPDSLCLLHLAQEIPHLKIIVAHFDHQLRPEAAFESGVVRRVAEELKVPFVSGSEDVGGYAAKHKLSLEEAARTLRYHFLFAQARVHGASVVAVGHTADDQVETILMHFLRGAGLCGLKGMTGSTLLTEFDGEIPLVRPILHLWRYETEAYCREHGLQPIHDPSNFDESFFRNRLRYRLIPELETYNPRFKEALLHTASALQGDHLTLQEVLESESKEIITGSGNGWVVFDQQKLAQTSAGMRRSLIREAAERLQPDKRDFGFEALNRGAEFVESPACRQIDFVNGLYLLAEGKNVYLATYEADLPSGEWPQVRRDLSVDGSRVELENGWVLTIEQVEPFQPRNQFSADAWTALLDGDLTGDKFTVRPRRAGDVFSPLGMNRQTVKLREFYIKAKIHRRARARWPLVCAGDQIVWVPGFRLAHPFRITETTRRAVLLRMEKK